jgi:hypothetical protein
MRVWRSSVCHFLWCCATIALLLLSQCSDQGVFDRPIGKAAQQVESSMQVGLSSELERVLQSVDGQSRSIPPRANGALLLTESIPSSSNEPSMSPDLALPQTNVQRALVAFLNRRTLSIWVMPPRLRRAAD